MKRFFPLYLILVFSTVFAVDMSEKIGMGVGWNSGIPGMGVFPNIGITKVGLSEQMALEPVIGFTTVSDKYSYNGTDYTYTTTNFFFMLLVDYAFYAHEKTNVYGKIGGKYGSLTTKYGESSSTTSEFGVPLGIGLEHFVSEHFAVDLNTIMGITLTSWPGGDHKTTSISINNQVIILGLLWYY